MATTNLEEIFDHVGGFGSFQLTMLLLIYGARFVIVSSMMMMSFAGVAPDWWCIPFNSTRGSGDLPMNTSLRDNRTYETCIRNRTSCSVVYADDMDTVVNEWDLICDLDKIPATITSVQMAGVLVGAFVGGQSSDSIGRKKTHFISMALHGISNTVAAFSTSWQMFAAVRFFIGLGIGGYLSVSYIYVVEFFGVNQRSLLASVPFWTIGTGVFALSTWLKPSWYFQHIIVGALHIPFLLGWFLVPDSLRWLTVQGRVEEAEKVVDQMSRYNKKAKSDNTTQILKQVAEEEANRRASGKKYTYLDIYRTWSYFKKSVIIQLVWALESLVFYGLSFGAASLSGNLYLNIFLLSLVEVPGILSLNYLTNRLGRRWTAFMYLFLAAISAFSLTVVSVYVSDARKGVIITVLALVSKFGIGTGWGAFGVLTTESYPTVIRNIASGAANTVSRIGGILAPFVFAMKKGEVFVPFLVVGSVTAVCSILSLLLEETMGRPLEETFKFNQNSPNKSNINEHRNDSSDVKEDTLKTSDAPVITTM